MRVLLPYGQEDSMKKRDSEEPIIRILREAECSGTSIREVRRQHNITEQTLYRWGNNYNGMEVAARVA